MTIAEKITRAKTDYDEVYEAGRQAGGNTEEAFKEGKQAAYDEFWDNFQRPNGEIRTDYRYAFAGGAWNDTTFKPKYDICPTYAEQLFAYSKITDLKAALERAGISIIWSWILSDNISQMFRQSSITNIGIIDTTACRSLGYFLQNARALVSIEKLIMKDDGSQTNLNTCFDNNQALENVVIEGVIGTTGLNLQDSPKLTHDSLMSFINALKDYSGSGNTYTIILGSDNIAKLTEAEIAIANNKGWDIA